MTGFPLLARKAAYRRAPRPYWLGWIDCLIVGGLLLDLAALAVRYGH